VLCPERWGSRLPAFAGSLEHQGALFLLFVGKTSALAAITYQCSGKEIAISINAALTIRGPQQIESGQGCP
jgi:hypothetical protein